MSDNTDLVPLSEENAIEYFKPNGLEPIIAKIKSQIEKLKPDTTTSDGRKSIASNARKVASAKVAIEKMGKNLTEDMRRKVTEINSERNRAVEELEALQKSVRLPLEEWEAVEEKRTDTHKKKLEEIGGMLLFFKTDSQSLIDQYQKLLAYHDHNFEEFSDLAKTALDDAEKSLLEKIDVAKKQEAEREELESLRKQAAEREEKDRAEQVKRDEEERQRQQTAREEQIRKDAEEKARRDADEAAKIEIERAERDKRLADERARIAEENRIASEQRAAEEKKIAEEKAERDRVTAEEKAKRDQEEAVQRERERIAFEEKKKTEEAAAREANKRHSAKINNEARFALQDAIDKAIEEKPDYTTNDIAKTAIEAIAKGIIPHVKIIY